MKNILNNKHLVVLLSTALLFACSNDMSDVKKAISDIKATTPADIEPIPEIKVYEKYTYQSSALRSPFMPDEDAQDAAAAEQGNGLRPNVNRNREFLEEFPLDSLTMVGTLNSNNVNYALVLTSDGLIHQIRAGNYIGQNEGEILKISEQGIEIRELVPDGLGGYIYRVNELPLQEVET